MKKPKIRFINYRKEFKGGYPINGWLPKYSKYWSGKIRQLEWRGYAIELDFRSGNLIKELLSPTEYEKFKELQKEK